DEAAAAGDPQSEALAALGYEQTYLETGRARTGVDARSIPLLDRALTHLAAANATPEDTDPLRARLLAAAAQARHFAGDREAALDMARQAADLARAASAPGAEAAALNTLRLATSSPETLDDVLTLTRQIVERAAEAGDVDLELDGLLWRIISLLEAGRRAESEAALARFATLAQRVRHPWRLSEMHRMQAMFAHLNGDLALARTEAEIALRFALTAGHAEARSPFLVLFAAVASTAEVHPEVETLLAQRTPQLTTFLWQSFVGWLVLAAGDRDRAARLGAMAMENGLETLARDQSWFSYFYGFVELAIELKEPEWAQVAYDALLPYADRYLVLANGAFCYGSAELPLARLAEVAGIAEAAAHYRRAEERNEAIGARVWLQSATPTATRVAKTFMFTDIVNSTNFAELLGDQAWGTLLRWHDQTLGQLFRDHSGEQVVSTGDGFFVAFEDAEHAIACARAIQQRLAEHRQTSGFAPEVRIGLHTTEATSADNNYSGRGVNEAARISALATGGQILASTPTAGPHAQPNTARTVTLKGITDPVEIVDIAWN
ncbi:MAG: adenylate/guanylate cyclase domain-containing protein, partial [Dehalococcoidia bacterium]|nr:adenylate/guanylate cyclase domain-containing protein [Dehalococcoidia bacterium]